MNHIKGAVITGCGSGGIGHALSAELKRRGFHVISTLLSFEDPSHLEALDIEVVRCDVTSEEDVTALKRLVEKRLDGRLSILINNAGICYTMTATDTQVDEVERMFRVNVFGPMRMVHHLHPLLVQAKGLVVNIGSVGGIVPYVYGASYNASKAALHHYGNTLRAELKPFGVRVVNIISGEVSTNVLRTDRNNQRKLPEESIYSALAEDFQKHIYRTPNTITPEQYARGVVDQLLKPSPAAWVWYGAQTGIVRWCDMLLPRTFWDWLFYHMFNFEKLANAVRGVKGDV
ncbi:short chain dehydrogenase [Aspergillus piperis CBS 112811]|uniref:Short chain dehydrogenase n=1 Tax=Aspergillus piperis CBS 112811 TaxID=1448313 RepID=A0A8G1QWP8_9EURO|nr:short chain dehydrogenase [Aspergillus piperis CBS 112811]RAH54237.1 short chain dehydrogenase [Aspergillus piperis CBS 112811]